MGSNPIYGMKGTRTRGSDPGGRTKEACSFSKMGLKFCSVFCWFRGVGCTLTMEFLRNSTGETIEIINMGIIKILSTRGKMLRNKTWERNILSNTHY